MPKSQDPSNLFILVGCISGLFVISTGLAFWIINDFRSSIIKLFDENKKLRDDLSELKGKFKERHK